MVPLTVQQMGHTPKTAFKKKIGSAVQDMDHGRYIIAVQKQIQETKKRLMVARSSTWVTVVNLIREPQQGSW